MRRSLCSSPRREGTSSPATRFTISSGSCGRLSRPLGTSWVASAGTHVFLAAPKDRRVCLPNTRFMIHQPSGGAGGQSTDIAIQAKEILRTRERIARVIAAQTGTPIERIRVDMERDYWMTAEEAIEYGIVSRIVETHADLMK